MRPLGYRREKGKEEKGGGRDLTEKSTILGFTYLIVGKVVWMNPYLTLPHSPPHHGSLNIAAKVTITNLESENLQCIKEAVQMRQ